VRNFGAIRGGGAKDDSIADRESARAVRRSIVAARELPAWKVLSAGDLDYVRPGTGLSPVFASRLVGRKLRRALRRHEAIHLEDLG
jgi:N,N'-diacetyllegionaminate synthase